MGGALYGASTLTEIILYGELTLQAIEESSLKDLMRQAEHQKTDLAICGPSGGVVEGWTNKQISESCPNCKFIAND